MHSYLSEHQKNAVEALKCLKKTCDMYGIKFYLLAGSTLGAIRHQGMIPWDDDIDVGLLHDDWYKLRSILSDALKDTKFTYIDDINDKWYPRLFGKITYDGHACVDLFLIAKWTSNKFQGILHWQIRRFAVTLYQYSVNYSYDPKEISKNMSSKRKIKFYIGYTLRRAFYIFSQLFLGREDYIKIARWNEKFFEGKNTGWYINLYSIYNFEKEMIKADWIENASYVKYEGDSYLTVGDTDAYLTHLYGDYMTPPPISQRAGNHNRDLFKKGQD